MAGCPIMDGLRSDFSFDTAGAAPNASIPFEERSGAGCLAVRSLESRSQRS
jgi:hypothetical protein